MASNTLYQTSVFKIIQDRHTRSLIFTWLKVPNKSELQLALQKGLELYQEFGGSWITDTYLMSGVDSELELWIHEEWLPKMLNLGLPRMAVILHEDRYLKLKSTEPIHPFANVDFSTAWFYTQADACNWIRKEQMAISESA